MKLKKTVDHKQFVRKMEFLQKHERTINNNNKCRDKKITFKDNRY